MTYEPAPERQRDEHPMAYILRVAAYLSEPDRRRLGQGTAAEIRRAVGEMNGRRTGVKPQKPHVLVPTWHSHGGELVPHFHLICPYDATDYEKPCRLWADDTGDSGECEPGCYARSLFDNLSVDEMSINVPDGFSGATIPLYVVGGGDDFTFHHPDLTYLLE